MLTFNLSVLLALGVGMAALATGNSPFRAVLKAGTALLVFSVLGWLLNWVVLASDGPLPEKSGLSGTDDEIDAHDNLYAAQEAAWSGQSETEHDAVGSDHSLD